MQLKITKIGKDLAFSTKILVDTTLALDEMVCRDMESLKPDCIVADFRTGRRSKTGFQYGSRYLSIKK